MKFIISILLVFTVILFHLVDFSMVKYLSLRDGMEMFASFFILATVFIVGFSYGYDHYKNKNLQSK